MALIDVYNAANDATFQGRCMAALWQTAQHVLADDVGYDLTPDSKSLALKVLRDQVTITPKQVAMQVLRNSTISANIAGATDGDIDWQVKSVWTSLMEIG